MLEIFFIFIEANMPEQFCMFLIITLSWSSALAMQIQVCGQLLVNQSFFGACLKEFDDSMIFLWLFSVVILIDQNQNPAL